MRKIKKKVSIETNEHLSRKIEEFIKQNPKIKCKAINRRFVSLERYIEATKGRRDRNYRKRRFFAGVELIRRVTEEDLLGVKKTQKGPSYEFKGITLDGKTITIHIREESYRNEKRLYLVSTF